MPQWIAEYKEKIRNKKLQKLKDKAEQKVALIHIEKLGLHPKDPRAKKIMENDLQKKDADKSKKKKKFGEKKKNLST